MKAHKVQQGEDMVTIAVKHGIIDWESIYNHTANQRLKEMRPDPMCLAPGDIVYIPDKEPLTYKLATNQSHTIKIPIPKVYFNLTLRDENQEPMSNVQYELKVGQRTYEGSTDGDGKLSEKIPAHEKFATLIVIPDPEDENSKVEYGVELGHLDPVEDVTGIQSKLKNLGIDTGAIDNDFGEITRDSIEAFQQQFGLEVTGTLDDPTLAKLKEL